MSSRTAFVLSGKKMRIMYDNLKLRHASNKKLCQLSWQVFELQQPQERCATHGYGCQVLAKRSELYM